MEILYFPPCVAGTFKRLTFLDLSCNALKRIPLALSQITTLRSLDMSYNENLQLDHSDAETLAALPYLKDLSLARRSDGPSVQAFSQKSVGCLIDIGRQFPDLVLHGFQCGYCWRPASREA